MGERGCHKREGALFVIKKPRRVTVPCREGNMDTIKNTGEGNGRNNAL